MFRSLAWVSPSPSLGTRLQAAYSAAPPKCYSHIVATGPRALTKGLHLPVAPSTPPSLVSATCPGLCLVILGGGGVKLAPRDFG